MKNMRKNIGSISIDEFCTLWMISMGTLLGLLAWSQSKNEKRKVENNTTEITTEATTEFNNPEQYTTEVVESNIESIEFDNAVHKAADIIVYTISNPNDGKEKIYLFDKNTLKVTSNSYTSSSVFNGIDIGRDLDKDKVKSEETVETCSSIFGNAKLYDVTTTSEYDGISSLHAADRWTTIIYQSDDFSYTHHRNLVLDDTNVLRSTEYVCINDEMYIEDELNSIINNKQSFPEFYGCDINDKFTTEELFKIINSDSYSKKYTIGL